MGMMMFGDIGIACIVGAVASFLAGIGFINADKQNKKLWKAIGESKNNTVQQ